MGNHKRSVRFRDDEFDISILEESNDRDYIERQEEYWITKLNTHATGLNETQSGKGWGHNSPKFTTLGYIYSEESREKMSQSARLRAEREGFEIRSKRSKDNFKNPEYLRKQKETKSGKRLRPPKLSDATVLEIRELFASCQNDLEIECEIINTERHKKNSSWKKINPARLFSNKVCDEYGVSNVCIYGIVTNKTRTKILPSLCGKVINGNEHSNTNT